MKNYLGLPTKQHSGTQYRTWWQRLHIDPWLFGSVLLLIVFGFFILYSASSQDAHMVTHQAIHILLALFAMLLIAQISPRSFLHWAPWLYALGLTLLIGVLIIGHIDKGAQRWLNLGLFRFQPSEIMKLAIPLCLAWYFHKSPLPPSLTRSVLALGLIFIPALLTIKQPDLGTGIILIAAGCSVLFLAGLRRYLMIVVGLAIVLVAPILWTLLHDYQRQRVYTFLNPESDPLGNGYHIIQSKIAIGSGGFFGKGWLAGTQSHLHFLPEHTTDFIFAVNAEEFGLVGSLFLITLYMLIVVRGLRITLQAQDTFSRLLAGGLTLTFFVSFFINIGMVAGILPVVGLPLPLISYGGTSMVTLLLCFGILMSIQTHRKLLTT